MKKTPGLVVLLLASAVTVSACGAGNGTSGAAASSTSGSTSTASATDSSTFNSADVKFAQDMIPHHKSAIAMAKLASSNGASTQVQQLASQIEAAQAPEIETMTGWLKQWGQPLPTDSMSGMDSGSMGTDTSSMPGMTSDPDMQKLQAARGQAFDRLFLQLMIKHHTSAVEMAKTEQSQGKNPDAIALAQQIEKSQNAEIAEMNKMLGG